MIAPSFSCSESALTVKWVGLDFEVWSRGKSSFCSKAATLMKKPILSGTPKAEFDSAKLLMRFEVDFSADVNAISPLVERVMTLFASIGCGHGKEFAIETALREALANAVIHGCKEDPSKQVHCSVYCDETCGILIVVRDPGPGFDPQSLPNPTQGQRIFSEHGRGVYLINQLMDRVEYQRGGTEIYMRKR